MMTHQEIKAYVELNDKYTHPLITLEVKEAQTDISSLKSYISFMKERNALHIISYLGLTVDEIRILNTMLNSNEKRKLDASIYLYLAYPTEITFEEYRKLTKDFNIYSVVVNGLVKDEVFESDQFARILDSRLWYEYLKNLYRLTNNINISLSNEDSNDREKKIFSILCKRIVESVTYDLESQEKFNKNKEYHSQDATNEIVGLIAGKCVCNGYAGIVRDACAIWGIDAIVVMGSNNIYGHAWNQAKLDGEWYNADITWDVINILNNTDTYWFLKSDEDFNEFGGPTNIGIIFHKDYTSGRTYENVCSNSVSKEKIKNYLTLEEKKKKNWLEEIVQRKVLKNGRSMKR